MGGALDTATLSLSIPAATPGTHYLIAKADADDVLEESNETNNTLARSIQVGPDLIIQTLTVPGTVPRLSRFSGPNSRPPEAPSRSTPRAW